MGMQYDSNQIGEILPHRYPFALVDKIVDGEPGEWARGVKCVTVNEPFFQGHFPQKHVMPGVLLIEAMAQVGGFPGPGEGRPVQAAGGPWGRGGDGVPPDPPPGSCRRRGVRGQGGRPGGRYGGADLCHWLKICGIRLPFFNGPVIISRK